MTGVEWVTDAEAADVLGVSLAGMHDLAEAEDWACWVPGDGVRRYLRSVVDGHNARSGDAPEVWLDTPGDVSLAALSEWTEVPR